MRDPIDSLTHLNPEDPVEQPPAAEIRRRGNALRRRRTTTIAIGAIAAVAAVVIPVALFNGPDLPIDPATEDPSSTQSTDGATDEPTDEPTGTVITEIPEDFPIETGLSTRDLIELFGPAERGQTGTEMEPFQPCGDQIWPASGVDTLDVFASGPEYWESRQLATYATAAEAVAVVEAARAALDGCAEYPGGAQVLEVLEGDTGYDDVTFGFYEASGMPGGSVVQMMRVGSAVVLVSSSGEFTEGSIQAGADDLTLVSQELATHMCVFTDAGCGDDTGTEGSGDQTTTSLADVPIDRYLPTGVDFEQLDPTAEGADALAVCGEPIWPADAVQSYGVMAVGPEQSEIRWISEYGDAELAAAVLATARTVVESCISDDVTQVIALEGDTGYDTVTYAEVQASGQPGGEVVQLMRVGNAILVSVSGGEFTTDSAQGGADEITTQSADLATEMCAFTEAGC